MQDVGFVIIPGPIPVDGLARLSAAYDDAVQHADPADVGDGRTTIRVHDFVNRGPEFDPIYVHPPVLDACALVINEAFKLSSLLARTVRPRSAAQDLHVDFAPNASGWPMLGFILMVDAFRSDNGATRFVPGSHRVTARLDDVRDLTADRDDQLLACEPAGSMIVYNGSIWHGHTANVSDTPRRSLQGAYVRRSAPSSVDRPARMRPETLARLGPIARDVLAL